MDKVTLKGGFFMGLTKPERFKLMAINSAISDTEVLAMFLDIEVETAEELDEAVKVFAHYRPEAAGKLLSMLRSSASA